MRVFACQHCGQLVFFENTQCLRCLSELGYVPERREMVTLVRAIGEGSDADTFADVSVAPKTWRRCSTRERTGCNWLVPEGGGELCDSCRLTRVRPADGDVDGTRELVRAEMAKRRLLFQLGELGLPVTGRDERAGRGLAFDLLSSSAVKVITGHDNGVITLDLAEADDGRRERLRLELNEPYRTVLGHFRHEIGHYYWPILVTGVDALGKCRELFGDDRDDYAQAVERHYRPGPHDDWTDRYISRYATMHPYEDWAETFAHYLHILDTLQVADSFGLGPGVGTRAASSGSFPDVIDRWLELSLALNQVNRCLGHSDLYPFVIAPTVMRKLAFVDFAVHDLSGRAAL